MNPQRSNASLAALLLVQRLVPVEAEPFKASEYWALLDRMPDPGRFVGASPTEIASGSNLTPRDAARAATLLGAAATVAIELERLEKSGVRIVTSLDHEYPARFVARLGTGAPPVIHAAGDLGLLSAQLLGVVGSRHVDALGAETARQAVRRAARQGMGVVTGAAKGVDQIAMQAALEAEAPVVGVLADSLLRVTRDSSIRRAVTGGKLCLLTPYKPSAGFSVANAMGRNKLVYALSSATLVIAADAEQGGTWAGAVEGIRRRLAPVLSWTGAASADGNHRLVGLGAKPISDLDRLFPLPPMPSPHGRQLSLEV